MKVKELSFFNLFRAYIARYDSRILIFTKLTRTEQKRLNALIRDEAHVGYNPKRKEEAKKMQPMAIPPYSGAQATGITAQGEQGLTPYKPSLGETLSAKTPEEKELEAP